MIRGLFLESFIYVSCYIAIFAPYQADEGLVCHGPFVHPVYLCEGW